MRQSLPAAVVHEDDPAAANLASAVPRGAKIVKLGGAILGYEKVPTVSGATQAPQKFTLVEMRGRHYRKVLRALVRARRANGVVIEDLGAWSLVAADIAAAIFGPGMTVKNVEGQCQFMGVDVDSSTLGPIAERAAQWRRAPNYRPLSGEEVGKLVKLSWRERDVLGRCQIGSFDETPQQRRRRQDRERQKRQRERAGARPRQAAKPWELLGMKRSTFYARNLHLDGFVRISLKEGKADETVQVPGKADELVQVSGWDSAAQVHAMGKADETVQRGSK